MTLNEDPEKTVELLRQQIADTRKQRMATQRIVAAMPNLELALERAARDRSSGATAETDSLREEIQGLREDIEHEARQIDRVRVLFPRVAAAYPQLALADRMTDEFNQDAQWRHELLSNERSAELRITLPRAEEIS